jgi:gamma-glutamylcyclotransferase (GGCT)/AIG2-like uncharacterized protein YtfP
MPVKHEEPDSTQPVTVFVYGTLKPGEINYERYCRGRIHKGQPAWVFGRLYALNLGYPALAVGSDPVWGVLLHSTDGSLLRDLDGLEGYEAGRSPDLNEYNRERAALWDELGRTLGEAWVYRMAIATIEQYQGLYIPEGQWSSSLQQRLLTNGSWSQTS